MAPPLPGCLAQRAPSDGDGEILWARIKDPACVTVTLTHRGREQRGRQKKCWRCAFLETVEYVDWLLSLIKDIFRSFIS